MGSGLAVSAIVPTVDGRDRLEAALPPLAAELRRLPRWQLIVADAGTTDGMQDFVRRSCPEAVVLQSADRLDFGANCNRAVAISVHPTVLVMNDDVRVTPGFLRPLAEACSADDVFAASPRILRNGPAPSAVVNEAVHRTFFSFGLIYHERLDADGVPEQSGGWPVSFACGAATAYRRERFLELGGFDDLFAPFYWEDFDLCYRAWKRGWRTVYEPASTVHHAHRGTIGRLHSQAEIDAIHERNRFLFAWKNLTDPWLTTVHLAFLPIKLLEGWARRHGEVGAGFRLACRQLEEARARRRTQRAGRTLTDRELLRAYGHMARAITRTRQASAGPPSAWSKPSDGPVGGR
ncbi:MAG: glycosyltransferase family 2 protein [Acidobacteriota bacterium]